MTQLLLLLLSFWFGILVMTQFWSGIIVSWHWWCTTYYTPTWGSNNPYVQAQNPEESDSGFVAVTLELWILTSELATPAPSPPRAPWCLAHKLNTVTVCHPYLPSWTHYQQLGPLRFVKSILLFDCVLTTRTYQRHHQYEKLLFSRKLAQRAPMNILQISFRICAVMDDYAKCTGLYLSSIRSRS